MRHRYRPRGTPQAPRVAEAEFRRIVAVADRLTEIMYAGLSDEQARRLDEALLELADRWGVSTPWTRAIRRELGP